MDGEVPDLEQRIRGWMEEELHDREDLATCTRNVVQRVKATGLDEALSCFCDHCRRAASAVDLDLDAVTKIIADRLGAR